MLWDYVPKDTEQFSIDWLDNSKAHCKGNVQLTYLEWNQRRGAAALVTEHERAAAEYQETHQQLFMDKATFSTVKQLIDNTLVQLNHSSFKFVDLWTKLDL